MERNEWMGRRLDGLQGDDVVAFGRGLRDRLRVPSQDAARIAEDEGSKLRYLAGEVAFNLKDQMIVPVVDLPPPNDPRGRARRFRSAIQDELGLRKAVLARVDELLGDKSPLPGGSQPDAGTGLTTLSAPRVCDAGYVLMRKSVYFGDDLAPDTYAGGAAFFALPEAERDAMIMRARASRTWAGNKE